ncbi:MAG TPA: hypothetical protein VHA13_02215 [Gammaproteobacteria bacterium]|nr:hypothetical protein [Gammaproteobacteria bacterium]
MSKFDETIAAIAALKASLDKNLTAEYKQPAAAFKAQIEKKQTDDPQLFKKMPANKQNIVLVYLLIEYLNKLLSSFNPFKIGKNKENLDFLVKQKVAVYTGKAKLNFSLWEPYGEVIGELFKKVEVYDQQSYFLAKEIIKLAVRLASDVGGILKSIPSIFLNQEEKEKIVKIITTEKENTEKALEKQINQYEVYINNLSNELKKLIAQGKTLVELEAKDNEDKNELANILDRRIRDCENYLKNSGIIIDSKKVIQQTSLYPAETLTTDFIIAQKACAEVDHFLGQLRTQHQKLINENLQADQEKFRENLTNQIIQLKQKIENEELDLTSNTEIVSAEESTPLTPNNQQIKAEKSQNSFKNKVKNLLTRNKTETKPIKPKENNNVPFSRRAKSAAEGLISKIKKSQKGKSNTVSLYDPGRLASSQSQSTTSQTLYSLNQNQTPSPSVSLSHNQDHDYLEEKEIKSTSSSNNNTSEQKLKDVTNQLTESLQSESNTIILDLSDLSEQTKTLNDDYRELINTIKKGNEGQDSNTLNIARHNARNAPHQLKKIEDKIGELVERKNKFERELKKYQALGIEIDTKSITQAFDQLTQLTQQLSVANPASILIELKKEADEATKRDNSRRRHEIAEAHSKQLGLYQQNRDNHYWFRDGVSRVTHFFFSCFGYEMEKQRRGKFINRMLQALKNYAEADEETQKERRLDISNLVEQGLKDFSPRTSNEKKPDFQKTLRCKLLELQRTFPAPVHSAKKAP